jgi:hypothetical protein
MRLNTERRELATEFTDSELDAVSGGEGNLANACIHATTQYLQDHSKPGFSWQMLSYFNCKVGD